LVGVKKVEWKMKEKGEENGFFQYLVEVKKERKENRG
jgi:hypothetical protein